MGFVFSFQFFLLPSSTVGDVVKDGGKCRTGLHCHLLGKGIPFLRIGKGDTVRYLRNRDYVHNLQTPRTWVCCKPCEDSSSRDIYRLLVFISLFGFGSLNQASESSGI